MFADKVILGENMKQLDEIVTRIMNQQNLIIIKRIKILLQDKPYYLPKLIWLWMIKHLLTIEYHD